MTFKECENIGRQQFETFLKQNYPNYKIEFTEGQYDDYDALMTGYTQSNKEVEMLVEIKKREYTTDFTNEWLLETDKVERCISIAQDMNRKPVFVNITKDKVSWNGHRNRYK